MSRRSNPIRQLLSPGKILIPIVIGVAIVGYFLFEDYQEQKSALSQITWTWTSTLWFGVALVMVALRDIGYMIRIRILTDQKLNWRQAFDVIMLWEFASSITPSIVGGSSVAIFIINREKISLGRSTAVVMITAFLDELFYVLMVPLLLLLVGWSSLFPIALEKEFFGITLGVREIFAVGYVFILLLITLIYLAIFRYPKTARNFLIALFSTALLKRWKQAAIETGDDLLVTSAEFKTKPRSFWVSAFIATFLSWTARFWVVNFLILSFTLIDLSLLDHFLIYARQLVMWVILLISPTPGGSGVAEVAFSGFLKSFISPAGLAISIGVLWRIISYYPYLLLGAIILPGWIQRVYLGRRLISFRKPGTPRKN
ncbi:MAG: lysylphosphatidylglycerol synthase transmembrane domain-containing protein [Salibacteraceae bacterium]